MTINKVFFLVILFALLVCCVSAICLVSHLNYDVAYASSSNGIVENNLISINDFSQPIIATTSSGFNIWRTNAQGTLTYNSNGYNTFGGIGNGQLWFYFDNSTSSSMVGNTYTLSLYTNYGLHSVVQSNISLANYSGPVISYSNGIQVHLRANNNSNVFVQFLQGSSSSNVLNIYWIKLELGSSFTGYVTKDYLNYGYNQGFQDAFDENQQGLLNNYVLYNKLDMFSLPTGSDSFFTYNNLNYRFNYGSSNNLFLETNVNLSWPLGSNGDANHRYMGFKFVDVSMPKTGCIVFYTSQSTYSGYFVFDNHTSSPFIVSLRDLQVSYQTDDPFSDYPLYCYYIYFDLPDASNIDLYYLSSIDTLRSNAGDSVLSTSINVYSFSDTNNYYQGYMDGKNTGYWTGYNQAYSEFDTQADYSFFGLLSAVIDTPIHAVGSMLDFELFGYNMKSFLISIISICVILVVAKFIIGLVL